jgi:hypothetical protein
MTLIGHVSRFGAKKSAYRVMMGKPEGKIPSDGPRLR